MGFRTMLSPNADHSSSPHLPKLYHLLRIKIASSTTYHPQTDGQTERVNQELEQYLRLFMSEQQDNWHTLLPLAEFAYNNHVHSTTQQTLFLLDTSHHPCMGFELCTGAKIEAANEMVDQMNSALKEAHTAAAKAKSEMAQYYNR